MTKKEIIAALRVGNPKKSFVTRTDIAKAFGMANGRSADRFVKGLDGVEDKYFLINDVAERIQEALR